MNRMAELGVISSSEKEAALAETLTFREPTQDQMASYFLDYMINGELFRLFGGDLTPVYQGGLEIYTTLDPAMQKIAQEIIAGIPQQRIDENGIRQPQGALVAMDPATGYVKALAGGRNFQETSVNRALSLRSPGSTFKPFLYAAALESGATAADKVLCEPITLTESGIDPYTPTDFGGDFHHRELTMRENPGILMQYCCDQDSCGHRPGKIGRDGRPLRIGSHLEPYFSLPRGYRSLLLELTAAFAPFANGGYRWNRPDPQIVGPGARSS